MVAKSFAIPHLRDVILLHGVATSLNKDILSCLQCLQLWFLFCYLIFVLTDASAATCLIGFGSNFHYDTE